LLAGVFPENFLSQGPHNYVSATAFVAIIAAQLLIWLGLKSEDSAIWGGYKTYSLISGLLSIILVILLKVAILLWYLPRARSKGIPHSTMDMGWNNRIKTLFNTKEINFKKIYGENL